jgi:hypothetical protein
MKGLSALENAVLDAIALQVPECAEAIASQRRQARVVTRENTGRGFWTTIEVSSGTLFKGLRSPVGFILANVAGLEHGMNFILWLDDGKMVQIEGSVYWEDTKGRDFETVQFEIDDPRKTKGTR